MTKDTVDNSIGAYWGSSYINDFTDRGRTKKVYMQADAPFRMQISDLSQYYLRNSKGVMTPLTLFAKVEDDKGSPRLERYQGTPSLKILGDGAPGGSSGKAMNAM